MSQRSDGHQCEVCGVYAPHGFKQKDGDFYWYCFAHRLEGYKLPSLAPAPGLKEQTAFDIDAPVLGDHSAMERVRNTFDWGYGLRTWIHWEMKPGDEMIGETMVRHAAKWIGESSNQAVIGAACLRMAKQGYLIDTGRSEPMKNESSHGRRSPVWRRSDKR